MTIEYIVTDNKGAGIRANFNLTIESVDDDSPQMGELPDSGLVIAFDNGDGTLRESINEDEVVQISTDQLLAGFLGR